MKEKKVKQILLNLPEELIGKIDEIAENIDMNRTALIRLILEEKIRLSEKQGFQLNIISKF